MFCKFFTTIGDNLAKNIRRSNFNYVEKNTKQSFDHFFKISHHEVLDIINRLKDETAAGFDGVIAKILKCIAVNIIQPLTYIFNLCIG